MNRHGAKLPSVAYGPEAKPSPCCPGHGPGGHGHGDVVFIDEFLSFTFLFDAFCDVYFLESQAYGTF